MSFDRREFLSLISGSAAAFAVAPLAPFQQLLTGNSSQSQLSNKSAAANGSCWLDVCAPFIVEDEQHGIHTEIVLTSDTFAGARGYEGGAYSTDYENYLYDAAGRAIGSEGVAQRLTVPAMRTTVIDARE